MTSPINRRSKRKYRNIYVDFTDQNKKRILRILKSVKRRWRIAYLLNENFQDRRFLKNFDASVETLTLARINCATPTKNIFLFPRLKSLNMMSCNEHLITNFKNCRTLSELQVSESESTGESFNELLRNNKDLKKLSIIFHTSIFKTIPEQLEFKLTKLVIDTFNEFISSDDRRSMKALMLLNSQSLEFVDINPWCGTEIIQVCFQMRNLRDLTFNAKNREDDLNWNLSSNSTIQRIHIRDVSDYEHVSFYDQIFKSAPRLEVYKSKIMHSEDLLALSLRCENIQELYIEEFNVSSLPAENCFKNFTRFKSWDTNDDLMRNLMDKGAKNMFEQQILTQ